MEQKLLKKLKKHQNAKVFVSMDSNNTQVVPVSYTHLRAHET